MLPEFLRIAHIPLDLNGFTVPLWESLTMTKTVEVPSKFGPIHFEVDATGPVNGKAGPRATRDDAVATDSLAGRATGTLENQLANIGRIVGATQSAMGNIAIDKAEVTLGIKVTGEGRFIVAKASAEASLTIKFEVSGKG